MALEIEQKFLEPDMDLLRERLVRGGATFCSQGFEDNFIFDTPDKLLRSQNILLRLRHAGETVLTLKKKPESLPADDSRYKILEEVETVVGDMAALRKILEHLGYGVAFRYQKFRATWQWESCIICLDTLPFTQVVELEGTPESIQRTAQRFGLDNLQSSTLNYLQLYRTHQQSLGLSVEDRFLFTKTQRDALMEARMESR
ncbi:adenylate cyclase, class 2 [Desulfonatronum thiosulfatophilum]|uniref:Adenylate cyclase, class 2 n=1 Tax=Desulfonatronum thiosulfatophilum TaxID=617002 RepID=A0A1G5ZZZ5_9BACT|nr:class IV adenylate cyclase [Desulfonatronum thiosulfatophilum]SDB01764.1 adenylate cyclase, class 2 [Desulfonatronum thiosulfatophilum]